MPNMNESATQLVDKWLMKEGSYWAVMNMARDDGKYDVPSIAAKLEDYVIFGLDITHPLFLESKSLYREAMTFFFDEVDWHSLAKEYSDIAYTLYDEESDHAESK